MPSLILQTYPPFFMLQRASNHLVSDDSDTIERESVEAHVKGSSPTKAAERQRYRLAGGFCVFVASAAAIFSIAYFVFGPVGSLPRHTSQREQIEQNSPTTSMHENRPASCTHFHSEGEDVAARVVFGDGSAVIGTQDFETMID
eukprot:SAG31_NODE_1587_length_7819_cov_3.703277_8_plen_143_part_01